MLEDILLLFQLNRMYSHSIERYNLVSFNYVYMDRYIDTICVRYHSKRMKER